jgi:hypothetical protein
MTKVYQLGILDCSLVPRPSKGLGTRLINLLLKLCNDIDAYRFVPKLRLDLGNGVNKCQ